MKKRGSKSHFLKGKSRPKEKRVEAAPADPPAVMSAIELGQIFGRADDTIRRYMATTDAPRQVSPGRWARAEAEAHIRLVDMHGGPKGFEMWQAEKDRQVGNVRPVRAGVEIPELGARAEENLRITAQDETASLEASTATTTAELLRLKAEHLTKAKMAEDIIKQRLANQERKRRLIPRQVVEEFFAARAQELKTLARKLTLELPPKLVGLERPELELRLEEEFFSFFKACEDLGGAMTTTPAPDNDEPAPAPDPVTAQTAQTSADAEKKPGT